MAGGFAEAEEAMAVNLIAALEQWDRFKPGAVAAGYVRIKSEAAPAPAMKQLAAQGWQLALPAVVGDHLEFRAHSLGGALTKGARAIPEPPPVQPAVTPSLILVPLLAFDYAGTRLGYGGGYYDRTLAALRAEADILAVGFAFAAQEVDRIPMSKTDQRLDWIVTEREAIEARGWKEQLR